MAREACSWEARFRPAGTPFEEQRQVCLERSEAAAAGSAWRAGVGSRPGDRAECLSRAHAGVERYRACMQAGGFRELSEGRVPYAKPGTGARETAIESRRCAQRSFEGSRYGPFSTEFETCLRRRGWIPPPGTDAELYPGAASSATDRRATESP